MNFKLLVAITITGLSAFSFSQSSSARTHRAESIENFKSILSRSAGVGHAISRFPPSLLQNYTLMRGSDSLQDASPFFPRAILFGHTANLIVTFNGSARQKGFDAFEVAEFNPQKKRIFFREFIHAPSANIGSAVERTAFAKKHLLEAGDIEGKVGQFVYTKPNPNKCMQCHTLNPNEFPFTKPHEQRNAKYIWSQYNTWKVPSRNSEAYGFKDDRIEYGYKEHITDDVNPSMFSRPPVKINDLVFTLREEDFNAEGRDYIRFRKKAKHDHRYRHLDYKEDVFVGYPYFGSYVLQDPASENNPSNLYRARALLINTPNFTLSNLLTANFSVQMESILSDLPIFEKVAPYVGAEVCMSRGELSAENSARVNLAFNQLVKALRRPETAEPESFFKSIERSLIRFVGGFNSFSVVSDPFFDGYFNWAGTFFTPLNAKTREINSSVLSEVVIEYAVAESLKRHDLYGSFVATEETYKKNYPMAGEMRKYLEEIQFLSNSSERQVLKHCDELAEALLKEHEANLASIENLSI